MGFMGCDKDTGYMVIWLHSYLIISLWLNSLPVKCSELEVMYKKLNSLWHIIQIYLYCSLYTKRQINKAIIIISLGAAAGFTASLFISKKLKKKNQFIMASCIMIVSAG